MVRSSALQRYVDHVQSMFHREMEDHLLWKEVTRSLQPLLNDPEIQRSSDSWPMITSDFSDLFNLLFYEDQKFGFVVNGVKMAPETKGPPHDHAPAWTCFGVLSGQQQLIHYNKSSEGDLVETSRLTVEPGFAELVPPHLIHAEITGSASCAMLIVRSQKVGDFIQNLYHPVTKELMRRKGPRQILADL